MRNPRISEPLLKGIDGVDNESPRSDLESRDENWTKLRLTIN